MKKDDEMVDDDAAEEADQPPKKSKIGCGTMKTALASAPPAAVRCRPTMVNLMTPTTMVNLGW